MKLIIKNKVPIKTCSPWNPVAKKKDVPKDLSLILNKLFLYSIICKIENNTPRAIVVPKEIEENLKSELIIEWWHHVTVTPDLIKIIELSRGIW